MNNEKRPMPQVPIPWLTVSPLAIELLLLGGMDPLALLQRQQSGDWGEIATADQVLNEAAINEGNALFSIYKTSGGPVAVITEANHLFAHIMTLDESPGRDQESRAERMPAIGMIKAIGEVARFSLGLVVMTPGAIDALARSTEAPTDFLKRHVAGDWGSVSDDDQRANEAALIGGERLLSAYLTKLNEKLWIITEADRSSTTVLVPDEY